MALRAPLIRLYVNDKLKLAAATRPTKILHGSEPVKEEKKQRHGTVGAH